MKVGNENPATSQRSSVISHGGGKAVAAMAGSFSRKISGPVKAGQNVDGKANQVEISFKAKSPGKQTWKGASGGFTTRSVPAYVASPANSMGSDTVSKSQHKGKQKVKAC